MSSLCFKYRHYLPDVIWVKTNQTVKKREGVHLFCVSALADARNVRMNRLPHFLFCQGFKHLHLFEEVKVV